MNKAFEDISQVFGWSLVPHQQRHSCGNASPTRIEYAKINNMDFQSKMMLMYQKINRESLEPNLLSRFWQCKSVFAAPNMATNEQSPQIAENGRACIKLESVDRISKLPVVESTYQMGKSVYDKVKDYNSVTNWTMSTAENTVCKAVQVGKPYAAPIVHSMEGPLKRVDGMLCTGLDYVESKVPAVKLPPTEVYNSTKDYIDNSPTVQSACSMVKPAVATAKGYAEPVMEAAKHSVQEAKNMVEPAIKSAKQRVGAVIEQAEQIVEPYIGSPKDKAAAIKEYLHPKVTDTIVERDEPEEDEKNSVPCTDCSLEVQKR